MTDEELENLAKSCVARLIEHCDSVQIFISRDKPSEGHTSHFEYGKGNWFTRYGHVKDWVTSMEENTKASVRAPAEGDSDEDL